MEFFEKAKTVRLKSLHGKYLWADEDGYKVYQCKEAKNILAHWRVERDPGSKLIRLKSCHQNYLTASDDDFLLGMTGQKVVQSKPKHIDSSVEWEPLRENSRQFRLKTCHGNFLRANKAIGPPWRNSVTHDLPHRMAKHQDYLLWEVEIVYEANGTSKSNAHGPLHENHGQTAGAHRPYVSDANGPKTSHMDHTLSRLSSSSDDDISWRKSLSTVHPSPSLSHSVSASSQPASTPPAAKQEGRTIYYAVANTLEEAKHLDGSDWPSIIFKGTTLSALKKELQMILRIDEDILLCARHATSNVYEIRLPNLPPRNAAMHIIVVKVEASSKGSRSEFGVDSDDEDSDDLL